MQPAARLYRPHIQALSARYDAALESSEFDAVLIGAGVPLPVHRDDQDYPYRPEPLFLQWAALQAHPGSALLYRPGRTPLLLVYEPDDFWHQAAPVPKGPWQKALDIRVMRRRDEITRHLPAAKRGKAPRGTARRSRPVAGPVTARHAEPEAPADPPGLRPGLQDALGSRLHAGRHGHGPGRPPGRAPGLRRGLQRVRNGPHVPRRHRPDGPGTALPGHRRGEPQRCHAALPAPGPAPPAGRRAAQPAARRRVRPRRLCLRHHPHLRRPARRVRRHGPGHGQGPAAALHARPARASPFPSCSWRPTPRSPGCWPSGTWCA